MDYKDLFTAESHGNGAEMQVKDRDGVLLDMFITVAGADSKVFRKELRELNRKVISNRDADAGDLRAESCAAISFGWRGFMDGETDVEFSKELVEQLYKEAPFIMDQVDAFANKNENFTKG